MKSRKRKLQLGRQREPQGYLLPLHTSANRVRPQPRPGDIIIGLDLGDDRVEIERVLGRNGSGWKVLGPGGRLLLIESTRTTDVWQSV